MKSFATSTVIRSRPEVVWSLLTDAESYPRWNSTVEKIVGRIALGESVTVFSKSAPGRAFPLVVTEMKPNTRMVWSGGMPLGLFKGERTFLLTTRPGGEVEFSMREEFKGLLAPLISRSIPDLQPAFDQFAADLKKRAEITV